MKKVKLLLACLLVAINVRASVTFENLGEITYRAMDDKLGIFVKEPVLYNDYETGEGSYYCWDIYSLADLSLKKQIKLKGFDENKNEEYLYISFDASLAQYESITEIYDAHIDMTQTLFNNDDKFEFVRAVYRKGEKHGGMPALRYEILNEYGEILCVLPDEFNNAYLGYPYIIGLKDGYALACEIDPIVYAYKINKSTTGLSLIKLSETKVYPNPVNSRNLFTIEVDETKLGTSNFVEVMDESGRVVYRSAVKTAKIQVPAHRMHGMNVYRVVSDSEVIDTGKILVK